jgi:hypothetical protein
MSRYILNFMQLVTTHFNVDTYTLSPNINYFSKLVEPLIVRIKYTAYIYFMIKIELKYDKQILIIM